VGGEPLVSSAGASLLVETARSVGLERGLSAALRPWRRLRASMIRARSCSTWCSRSRSVATAWPIWAVVRAQPDLFGAVASDPTVSRLIDTLAGDAEAAVAAIRQAGAVARAAGWRHRSPVSSDGPVTVDLRDDRVGALGEGGRRRRSSARSASTRCWRSSTTAATGLVSR